MSEESVYNGKIGKNRTKWMGQVERNMKAANQQRHEGKGRRQTPHLGWVTGTDGH